MPERRSDHHPHAAPACTRDHSRPGLADGGGNGCLTCPDFQTTPEFLDVHREQASANRVLIARADAGGHFRLAANLRQVQTSLDRIVPALEAIVEGHDTNA